MKRKTALVVLVLILTMICSACGKGGTITINGKTYTFEEYEQLEGSELLDILDDDSDGEPNTPQGNTADNSDMKGFNVSEAPSYTLELTEYSNEIFSMTVPAGWQITYLQYPEFALYIYDPIHPERQIFIYTKLAWFNKSESARQFYGNLASMVSESADIYGYHLSARIPALPNGQTSELFSVWRAYTDICYQENNYDRAVYPVLDNFTVLERTTNGNYTTPGCTDYSILRATFTDGAGFTREGLFSAEISDVMQYYQNGIDVGMYHAYDVAGITASEGDFEYLEPVLSECLGSFDLSESYVQNYVSSAQNETDRIIANARSMQAVYDSYNSAWSARQSSYDIISQKNSDATLGYDRLYDSETGEIYRAELGFYDSYDLHRDEYSNPNLQIIDGTTENYYTQGIDYYITK